MIVFQSLPGFLSEGEPILVKISIVNVNLQCSIMWFPESVHCWSAQAVQTIIDQLRDIYKRTLNKIMENF